MTINKFYILSLGFLTLATANARAGDGVLDYFYPQAKDGSVVGYGVDADTSKFLYEHLDAKERKNDQADGSKSTTKTGKNMVCSRVDEASGTVRHFCLLLMSINPKTERFNGRAGDSARIK